MGNVEMGLVGQRESLSSRVGFLFLSAGCAIGLGNVWRFPYVTGKYGGAIFVLLYLLFLVCLGLPVIVMEFSVGRAARMNLGVAFRLLEPKGSKWHFYGHIAILANYLLMMFYTTVAGWMLAYFFYMARGDLVGLSPDQVGAFFDSVLENPLSMTFWMLFAVIMGFVICLSGLRKGIERSSKFMMSFLLVIMLVLVVRSLSLPGAREGVEFYLMPDFGRFVENGIGVWETVYAAMGQAFFTLSLGIGSLAIFGSYVGKERRLTGESLNVLGIDTFVALMSGLIIFPACFAFGVDVDSGPGLIFVTLPNVFNAMPAGRLWGSLFFVFMSFASMTTVIAVFENIVSYAIDVWGWSRKKACLVNTFLISLLSMPCILGFNLWSEVQPLGEGSTILDLEDFIVSNNFLPIGSMVFLLFCCHRYGWGWDNFIAEADLGKGLKFPKKLRFYVAYILPAIVFVIFILGYIENFR